LDAARQVLAALAVLAAAAGAHADDRPSAAPSDRSGAPSGLDRTVSGGPPMDVRERPGFGLGMGVAVKDDPYVDLDREIQPFPIFRYVGERFSALGPNLKYRLAGDRRLAFSALVGPSFDGYDPDDSDFLDGMDERKLTVEGGVELDFRARPVSFSLSARHDLLSRHEGYQLEAEASTFHRIGRVALVPSLAYTYWDENRSDYYFGVRGDEAREGRPAYSLDGTSNWSAGLFAAADVTPSIFLMLGAKYFFYDDDIADSPILDDDSTWRIFAGAGYQFGARKARVASRDSAPDAAPPGAGELAERLAEDQPPPGAARPGP
jgi:outer membrane protein